MRKTALPFVILLFLIASATFFILTSDRSVRSQTTEIQSEAGTQSHSQKAGSSTEYPCPAVSASTARKNQFSPLSSPAWRPSAVFGRPMAPVPALKFPRGENGLRRYHDPETRNIDPGLATQPTSVLARSPADGRFHLLPEEIDAHTKQGGRLVFDPAALNRVIAGQTSRVLAPTLTEEVLTLEFKNIKTRSATTHTFQGHVMGEEKTSIAQIVYHDGIIHGSVMRYDTQEEIEYRIMEDGHMMVREIDLKSFDHANCGACANGDHDHTHSHSSIEADIEEQIFADVAQELETETKPLFHEDEQGPAPLDTTGWRTIDVTVGYTAEARAAQGGTSQIEGLIIDSVDRMTLAFANSGIADTELMLVGTIEDPDYVERTSQRIFEAHNHLRFPGDGELESITDLHNRLGSDLVAVIVSEPQGGTQGVAGGRTSATSRSSMTAGQMTFVHELGHNLGCAHAWGDTSTSNTGINLGWRFQGLSGTKYTTIMAYTSGWGSRIPYFSNPNVLHPDGDIPIGVVAGYNYTLDPNPTLDPALEAGYDGSVPTRGANNANVIDTEQGSGSANSATRSSFEVVSPLVSDRWEKGTTRAIQFNGGDHQDLATIELYKGGALHSTLATDVNAALVRNFEWTIPFNHAEGTDFMIRVELTRNGSTLTADSGLFEIFSDLPHVDSAATVALPQGLGPVTALTLTFNVPMNPVTFDVASDIVSFTDPDGTDVSSLITGSSWSSGNTVLTLELTPPTLIGSYQLVIGPQIEDALGNLMDQDEDGTNGEGVEDRYTFNFEVLPPLGYYASMDTDPGWTFSANNPAQDGWEWGQPTGNGTNPYISNDPDSGFNGPNVIGYNLNGDYQQEIPSTRWATTPVINCSNLKNVKLRFQRWMGIYYAGTIGDNAYIQVSNDGTSWTTVWQHDNSKLDDGDWVEVEYDISAVADGRPTVYVRWGLGTTDKDANNAGVGPGWNIDEVIVFGDALDDIILLSHDGGGAYFAGASLDISWASSLEGNVQIDLLKNGTVDTAISSSTANDGSLTWTIPANQTPGSDYRVRITSLSDPTKTVTSAADFTINAFVLNSPDGETSYFAGTPLDIAWESDMGGNVQIDLLKNGSVDSTISSNTANDGSFTWTIPASQAPGADYRVRITSLSSPTSVTTSAADFTINAIILNTPDGGGSYFAGTPLDISWESGMGGNVQIDLLKNGSVDSTISSTTANDGSFTWTIPASQDPGADYRVRISSLSVPGRTATSAADFTIGAFTINSPDGGGSYFAGTPLDLSWTSSTGGNVQIELLKNGSVDSMITPSTANDGQFTWQIPQSQTLGSDYRIRITSLSNPSQTISSAADFTITSAPSVPYSESFESGLGDWVQEISNDFDWARRTGSTPSDGTGPSIAQDGSYYLFTEASYGNNPAKLAQISCWFNLQSAINPELSFYYHMRGAAMGTLKVEASTDGVNWAELFLISGDQGDAWTQATVSLSDYTGQLTEVRISGTTGSSFTSDMAIDNLSLSEASSSNSFANWIAGYDVGGQTALTDDYDGDGDSNAEENYFGTRPDERSSSMSAGEVGTSGNTTFTFTHPVNPNHDPSLTATYIWSKDLGTFYEDGFSDGETTVSFDPGTPVDDMVTVTATITGTGTDRIFVDVHVTSGN
jgi:hypothetical protein